MTAILDDIIKGLDIVRIKGNTKRPLSNITFDSRNAAPGVLFVAVRGTRTDGHDYIRASVASGAEAVVCEHVPDNLPEETCILVVKDSARALGELASAFYGYPSRRFKLTGVTGTNGKTTTVTLLHHLFTSLGYQAGCFTTIRNYIGQETVEATHTTPDPVQLNRIMKDMADKGCQYVFMEVSSHALIQQRIAGLNFAGGLFTNITHDHLDYHKTFDEYLKAKKLFFDDLSAGTFACINADDRNGKIMVQNTKSNVYYYGLRSMADFKGRIMENHLDGTLVNFDNQELWTRFIGEFNAYNLLAVYAAARLLGQDKQAILQSLSSLETVEGRFQYLRSPQEFTAVIDYAHTPDALLNVLKTIGQMSKGKGQVISVIGAGGNRTGQSVLKWPGWLPD